MRSVWLAARAPLGCCRWQPASAQTGASRKYGGTLEIGTVYVTLSALSWDPGRLELEAQPRHRPVLRAAVRRRPRPRAKRHGGKHPFYRRRLAALRRHPRRAGRELGVEAESAARRDQAAQGRHVPRKARRDGVARADRRRRRLQPTTASPRARRSIAGYFDHRRQGRGHRQAHGRLHLQVLQRRMGLSLRLGLLLRRSCPRKWPTPAPATGRTSTAPARSCSTDFVQGNSNTYVEEPDLLGQGEDRRRRVQAAVRRQARLSHHQGRGDLHHRAAHRQARHARKRSAGSTSTS